MEARKVTVELNWDAVDDIVKQELISCRTNLKDDLKRRKKGTGLAIFETDKDTDIALINDHIKAFDIVLKYFGVDKDE